MVEAFSPTPIVEVAIGILGLVGIIFLHGAGIRIVNRRFNRFWVHVTARRTNWRMNLSLAVVIGSLATLHMFETLVWAVPLSAGGLIPDMRDSYYYVLQSYTTLGEGTVALPDHWRLIGPIIAISGLFTFGWTGSVLVNIMTEFGRLDRAEATRDLKDRQLNPGSDRDR